LSKQVLQDFALSCNLPQTHSTGQECQKRAPQSRMSSICQTGLSTDWAGFKVPLNTL